MMRTPCFCGNMWHHGLQGLPALAPVVAYRYVLLKLGPITVTRRSISLAIAASALTFTALQASDGLGTSQDAASQSCVCTCTQAGAAVLARPGAAAAVLM